MDPIRWKEQPTITTTAGHEYRLPHNPFYVESMGSYHGKIIGYFDNDLVYRTMYLPMIDGKYKTPDNLSHHEAFKCIDGRTVTKINGKPISKQSLKQAMSMMSPGMTLRDMFRKYNKCLSANQKISEEQTRRRNATREKQRYANLINNGQTSRASKKTARLMAQANVPFDVYAKITKIETPMFERERDNSNKKSFDFIRISALTIEMPRDETKAFLSENKTAVIKLILAAIRKSKTFQNFGVPINFLRLSNCVLTNDHRLEFLFELKKID